LPPPRAAYGIDTILDQHLVDAPTSISRAAITALVHVSGSEFSSDGQSAAGQISHHA